MNNNEFSAAPVTESELNAFVRALSDLHFAVSRREYPTCPLNWTTIEVEVGRKFARLISVSSGGGRPVYGFIDMATGDLYKAAGYNSRAKGARGNIRVGGPENAWNGACARYSVAYRHHCYPLV